VFGQFSEIGITVIEAEKDEESPPAAAAEGQDTGSRTARSRPWPSIAASLPGREPEKGPSQGVVINHHPSRSF
jgi:hypothetical protein